MNHAVHPSVDDAQAEHDPELFQAYVASLTDADATSAIGYELEALESIYPASIRLNPTPSPAGSRAGSRSASPAPSDRIRYEISLPAWEGGDEDAPRIRVLVSLPRDYPQSAPLLQLLGRYVGAYPIDAGLFGAVTRTFISSSGVPFTPGTVAVFDGLVYIQQVVQEWYEARESEAHAEEVKRESERAPKPSSEEGSRQNRTEPAVLAPALARAKLSSRPLPKITSSEPITDRKSAFVGHACRIVDESDVAGVVGHLLEDKKIARAAHPTIWAYRVVREVGGAAGRVVECDYDDDGETQAGSRLKHLLEILELENVLVVVTRWYGGIHLGPDRFKHINQAARVALEDAGFLDEPTSGKKKRRG